MVKTRHGGGDDGEADESLDTEQPHCSSGPKRESLGTKETCVNVSADWVRRNTAPASPTAPAGNYRTGA